ncbi:MAG: hypothetical protein ACK4QW_06610 [Alphaproteobacteria bacterium]
MAERSPGPSAAYIAAAKAAAQTHARAVLDAATARDDAMVGSAVRVEPAIKKALERAAKADDRSVSSLVERILKAWLVENGHLSDRGAKDA